ncbi:MAG TPA: tyrosine--tRNA ligase [Xanthobacteraceae bacterium]
MNASRSEPIAAAVLSEVQRQHAILSHGTAAVYPGPDEHGFDGLHYKLADAVAKKRPLKVKLGMDPTAPDLHLGHSIVLGGMRRFQDLGHIAQPLIGDYTARIGDPAGRNKTRPPLSDAAIDANASTYFDQVFQILDSNPEKLELLYNGQWLSKLTFSDTIKLCAQVTVAQIIAREDFAKRLSENTPISMHELLYPIMQGYDSIAMNCDVEVGGTDQTFNCLMGRQLMQARGLEPQIVMTFPLLEGTDGIEKMSKSKGNYIALTDVPANMYGKVMSIPDSVLGRYHDLLTPIPHAERDRDPYGAKKALARLITARFHGAIAADGAAEDFATRFSAREIPIDLPEQTIELPTEWACSSCCRWCISSPPIPRPAGWWSRRRSRWTAMVSPIPATCSANRLPSSWRSANGAWYG